MNHLPISLFALGVAAALPAQSVTATITALTPITVSHTAFGQTATDTQPAGPLTGGLIEAQFTLGNYSRAYWSLPTLPGVTAAVFGHDLESADPTGTAVAGTHEYLVAFTATAPVGGSLRITNTAVLSGNVPAPLVAIDVDNDGNVDGQIPTTAPVQWSVTFSTQPKLVRLIVQSTLQGAGNSFSYVQVEALPDNQLSVTRSAIGCAVFDTMAAVPVFEDRGIDCRFVQPDPTVFVLGLSQQPVILPPNLGQTCLLLPSTDIIGWNPEGVHHVALPAAVRPVVFHVQGVALTLTGLLPTDAYTVYAY